MRGRARAEAGGKLASTQIITCVHTCAVAERWRSGGKNRSARNGSNTQFAASASKPRAPNHHCPQEMADPPASAPRMCEHTRGSGAGISKSARLRPATAPRMCERSLNITKCPPVSVNYVLWDLDRMLHTYWCAGRFNRSYGIWDLSSHFYECCLTSYKFEKCAAGSQITVEYIKSDTSGFIRVTS